MGEIKIKSGNLGESFTNREHTAKYFICLLGMLDIKPSTSYTISFIMEEGAKAYFNEYLFVYKDFTGTGQRQVFNITTKADIDKNASTWVTEYGWILCKNLVNNENPCNFREVMILEGTYTSETIPEYQPYFLNRPAHQFINGERIDIPTHHFINGRWQGELTSQRPLKFRADGEMLDWRVEGKTSKNLWDGTFINTSGWGVSFSLDDEGYMVASSNSDPRGWEYTASQIKMTLGAGTYALVLQGIPPTQSWSGAMIYTSGGSALANNQNLVNKPLIIMPFTLTQETSIGIMVKVVNGKYRVQLLEGTYTASTLPPYEPYGGVGDWDETEQKYKISVTVNGVTTNLYTDHQLMDGDSIDYTTTETTIPLATGNNTLMVDTAVQPSKVFVKFEG